MDALSEQDAKIFDLILSQNHSFPFITDSVIVAKFFDENKLHINYLDSLGYIRKHGDYVYSISSSGKLFINSGGFTRIWKEKEDQLMLCQYILTNEDVKNDRYFKNNFNYCINFICYSCTFFFPTILQKLNLI